MLNIPLIKGRDLDVIAFNLGLKRKRIFWFIKESDKSLRARLVNRVQQVSSGVVRPMHTKFVGV